MTSHPRAIASREDREWAESAAGQRAVVALKVRELLQPAAKERHREAVIESNKARAADPVSADLRSMDQQVTP